MAERPKGPMGLSAATPKWRICADDDRAQLRVGRGFQALRSHLQKDVSAFLPMGLVVLGALYQAIQANDFGTRFAGHTECLSGFLDGSMSRRHSMNDLRV
ncbi:MAG: hypothetical protein ABI906_08075 [Pseudomonadota bacterium]